MKPLLAFLATSFLSIGFAFAAVNVNTASEAELQRLKGIDPTQAKAIVDYRKKHGPFKSLEDLRKVQGISDRTLNKLRKELTLVGPDTHK